MIITPVLWAKDTNQPTLYTSERVVYTNIDGKHVAVSQSPYLGRTRAEVISQAIGNIDVRRKLCALYGKYRVTR